MNFLAHLFLSGDNEEVAFGNFIADAVKGSAFGQYPPGVVKGIRLHRSIDHFTDAHPLFLQSKARLSPHYGMYSGIIVDIFYDHFLARNWKEYSQADLGDFVGRAYGLLIRRYFQLPSRSKRILPFMVVQNWLVGYARIPDLQRVFNGMSRRVGGKSGMEHAITDLMAAYSDYEDEFRHFFPQLINHAAVCREELEA
jgi:acyl carrier protein phosphodiesterase